MIERWHRFVTLSERRCWRENCYPERRGKGNLRHNRERQNLDFALDIVLPSIFLDFVLIWFNALSWFLIKLTNWLVCYVDILWINLFSLEGWLLLLKMIRISSLFYASEGWKINFWLRYRFELVTASNPDSQIWNILSWERPETMRTDDMLKLINRCISWTNSFFFLMNTVTQPMERRSWWASEKERLNQ